VTPEIALYTPNTVQPDFDTSFKMEPEPPKIGAYDPPEFVRPVLHDPKKSSLDDRTHAEPRKTLFRFGVVMEEPTPEVLSEVTRDLIGLISSLPPNSQLVVASTNSTEYWDKVSSALPVLIQFGDFDMVKTWKVYWFNEKPRPPEGVSFKFDKRIGNPNTKRIVLRPNTDVPMPINRDADRMLPLGMNPAFRRPPAQAPVQMTPQLYLWSSSREVLTSE
jgi:hypothetical protein